MLAKLHREKSLLGRPKAILRMRGITLIELLITIAILGILVALTVPAFTSQTAQTRRADAASVLTMAANQMESYGLANGNSFIGAVAGTTFPEKSPRDGTAVFYTISVSNLTATTYTLNAVPQVGQASDACGTLWIDQSGRRGADDSIDNCWR